MTITLDGWLLVERQRIARILSEDAEGGEMIAERLQLGQSEEEVIVDGWSAKTIRCEGEIAERRAGGANRYALLGILEAAATEMAGGDPVVHALLGPMPRAMNMNRCLLDITRRRAARGRDSILVSFELHEVEKGVAVRQRQSAAAPTPASGAEVPETADAPQASSQIIQLFEEVAANLGVDLGELFGGGGE